jgi:uncharacterized protein
MSLETSPASGTVVSVLRYPVKSMLGEELNAAWMGPGGLLGDRAFALISTEDGKVVSAKNPRKWPGMFDCRAGYVDPPRPGEAVPPIRITLPDGTALISGQDDIGGAFSRHFGHAVTLASAPPDQPRLEEYWPDMEELDHRDTVTNEAMPPGTFFDLATVHLLTTATLAALGRAYPEGRFEVRRFRPNLVIAPPEPEARFMDDDWIDHVLSIGDEVRLRVTGPCPRCVMTTLAQADLPHDPHVLRTAARLNKAHVGVYASVLQTGWIRRGDPVRVLP